MLQRAPQPSPALYAEVVERPRVAASENSSSFPVLKLRSGRSDVPCDAEPQFPVLRLCTPANSEFSFQLKNPKFDTTVKSYPDYSETSFSIEDGFTRGDRRANNGLWTEKWMEHKKTTSEAEQERTLGVSSGEDISLLQRWSSKWQEEGTSKSVEKHVFEYSNDQFKDLTQEWHEKSTLVKESKSNEVIKEGIDYRPQTPREWRLHEINEVDSNDESQKLIESHFEELIDGTRKSKHVIFKNGSEKETTVIEESNNYSLFDQWIEAPNEKHGKKEEENLISGCRSTEEWSESADGSKTITRRTISADKRFEKVDINKFSNETMTETKITKLTELKGRVLEVSKETYNASGNRKWGKRKFKSVVLKEDYDLNVKTEVPDDLIKNLEIKNINWHDNGTEYVADEVSNILEKNEASNLLIRKETTGHRYSDGTRWRLYEEEKLNISDDSSDEVKNEIEGLDDVVESHNTKIIEKNGEKIQKLQKYVLSPSILRLFHRTESDQQSTTNSTVSLLFSKRDNSWKETNGNCWGEKIEDQFDSAGQCSLTKKEHWYDNTQETQTDVWEESHITGKRSGYKIGKCYVSGDQWKENWVNDESNVTSIEKHWKKFSDGKIVEWGEDTGSLEDRRWVTTWGKSEMADGTYGDEWQKSFDDYGSGKTKTEERGSKWSKTNSDCQKHVVDRYLNKYGEDPDANSKWAYKEGENEAGDIWSEQWHESPNCTEASKTGSNARGDKWLEQWKETAINNEEKEKKCVKEGSNVDGDGWKEEWIENNKRKWARKIGCNNSGGRWQEEWEEVFRDDGKFEKWCSKNCTEENGEEHGESWGDRWNENGQGGHHWGDKWAGDYVHKYWFDF